jgi:hypothetical protein
VIRPHVPELGLPPGHERERLIALRALRNCGVIRVTLSKVPLGYRLLQKDGFLRAKGAPEQAGGTGYADCRLTDDGHRLARQALK